MASWRNEDLRYVYRRMNAKKETMALEKESKQMEERLQELKMAMIREKEDKE